MSRMIDLDATYYDVFCTPYLIVGIDVGYSSFPKIHLKDCNNGIIYYIHYVDFKKDFTANSIKEEELSEIKVGQVWERKDSQDSLEITEILNDVVVIGTLRSSNTNDVVGFKYPFPRFKKMWNLVTDVEDIKVSLPEGYQINSDLLPTENVKKTQDSYTQMLLGSVETTGRKVGWDD